MVLKTIWYLVEDELTPELEEEKENVNNVLDMTSNIDGDVYEDDIL